MKHGDLVKRLQYLDDGIQSLLDQQRSMIEQSRKLFLSSLIVLGRHARGHRSFLRWRQRYEYRQYLELDHAYCVNQVRACLRSSSADSLIELEQARMSVNYRLNTMLYERDRLRDLKAGSDRCRKLVRAARSVDV